MVYRVEMLLGLRLRTLLTKTVMFCWWLVVSLVMLASNLIRLTLTLFELVCLIIAGVSTFEP